MQTSFFLLLEVRIYNLSGPFVQNMDFWTKRSNWTRSCAKSVGNAMNRSTQNFERYNIEIVNTVSKPKK